MLIPMGEMALLVSNSLPIAHMHKAKLETFTKGGLLEGNYPDSTTTAVEGRRGHTSLLRSSQTHSLHRHEISTLV